MSLADRLREKASTSTSVYQSEVERIVSLPIEREITSLEVNELNNSRILAEAYDDNFRFLPGQDASILQYQKYGGAFCIVVVGGGKTLACQTIASMGFEKGLERIMILVPSSTYDQFQRRDIQFARRNVVLSCPFHFIGGKPAKKRMAIARAGYPGVYVVPYSLLQLKDGRELIETIKPELIIADEMHYLKNRRSARTERLFQYINKYKPEMVGLSGTITDKSINDYHHLIKACLGDRSPLPKQYVALQQWSMVLDSGVESPDMDKIVPITPITTWARKNFPDADIRSGVPGIRESYQLRLRTTPGVVHKNADELGVSLYIKNKPVRHEQSEELQDLINQVDDEWVTPNGDPIDHAIHKYRWLSELNCGFWHKLEFPTVEELCKSKGYSLDKAEKLLESAKTHHEIHNEYLIELRSFLSNKRRPGLDTPFLVGQAIHQDRTVGLPDLLVELYHDTKAAVVKDMPERESTPIVVDTYRAKAVADMVEEIYNQEKRRDILIFYHWTAFAQMIVEEFKRRGVEHYFCPAGGEYNRLIIDPKTAEFPTLASVNAHGAGKNLQHFGICALAQPVRSAKMMEQALGRTHRTGQTREEVMVINNLTTPFDHLSYSATLNDAFYIQQSTGVRQKILYGDYIDAPRIFESSLLEEKGFDPKRLDPSIQKALTETFAN